MAALLLTSWLWWHGAALLAETAAPDAERRWNGARHVHLARETHAAYDLELEFDSKGRRDVALSIAFAAADEANHYRLELSASSCLLVEVTRGRSSEVARVRQAFDLSGTHNLRVRRHRGWLGVELDHRWVLHVLHGRHGPGDVYVKATDKTPAITHFRTQPVDAIQFADDFMRSRETPDPWEPVRGTWELHTVARPDAEYRRRRRPEPERSPNYFYYQGTPDGTAISLAGRAFWSDYTYSVAVSAEDRGLAGDNAVGLLFAWRDENNHFLLRWQFQGRFSSRSTLEMVRVLDGKSETLRRAELPGETDQWYLMQVRLLGGRIEASIDGRPMMDLEDSCATGGRIGLYGGGPGASFFDDVVVQSTNDLDFSLPDGSPDPARVQRRPHAPGSYEMFGSPDWDNYIVSAQVRPNRKASAVGLGARLADPRSGLVLQWDTSGRNAGRMRLLRLTDGKAAPLAETTAPADPERSYTLELDLTQGHVARVTLDRQLVLHASDPSPGPGLAALYSDRPGTEFRYPRLAFSRDQDIEQPVANRIFVDDPFMQGWANPRWVWLPEGKTQPEELKEPATVLWHKGDFYAGFTSRIAAAAPGVIHFGLSSKELSSAYALAIERPDEQTLGLRLTRCGQPVRQTSIPVADCPQVDNPVKDQPRLPQIELGCEDGCIWVKAGIRELITYRDDAPLRGPLAAIERPSGQGLNSEHVEVERKNVVDEQFAAAPTRWIKVGDWEITNRFQCDPRWSHYAGWSRQAAALWSKHEYDGDLTVEYHAGMKHGRAYYRPGDINLTLCADGMDYSSGYSFLITAWDEGWSGLYSRILRRNTVVAQTDLELCPRVRESAGQRHIQGLWNPKGRDIHGAWYYVKVRKIGNRIECYFENRLVMAYEDPDPLPGKRLAFWTLDNEIVLAKMKISYSGNRRLPEAADPVFKRPPASKGFHPVLISSPDRASRSWTFESGLEGWETLEDEGALLTLEPHPDPASGTCLRLANPISGGTFSTKVPAGNIDLLRCSELRFDYRCTPEARLNFIFTLGDRRCFVRFTGPDRSDDTMLKLGEIGNVLADGAWHRARFDLGLALRRTIPQATSAIPSEMVLGQLEEGYLRAGFDGNTTGASCWLDNVQLVATGPPEPVRFSWTFQDDAGRPLPEPGSSVSSVCLDGRPDTEPDPALAKPDTSFQAAPLTPGRYLLHVKSRRASGPWTATLHYPFDVHPASLSVAGVSPAPGASWGGDPIQIRFSPHAPFTLNPATLRLFANGQPIQLQTAFLGQFDWDTLTLTLDMNHVTVPADGVVRLGLKDGPNPVLIRADPANVPGGKAPSPDAAATPGEWSYRYDPKIDRCPPSRIEIAGPTPLGTDFEDGSPGPFTGRGATLRVDETTAASGRRSLRVTNPTVNGSMEADLAIPGHTPLDVGRFPLLLFDYRVRRDLQFDLALVGPARLYYARFTDRDSSHPRDARIGFVQRDGQWHNAEVQLKRILDAAEFDPLQYQIERLRFGDWGFQGNGPRQSFHVDNVQLLPAVSTAKGLEIDLRAADLAGIDGFSFQWGSQREESPDLTVDSPPGKKVFQGVPEGIQYLHLRARDRAGNWSQPAHFGFYMDNTAPEVRVDSVRDSVLTLSIRDAGSGVDPQSLSILIDGRGYALASPLARWKRTPGSGQGSPPAAKDGAPPGPEYPATPALLEWDWAIVRGPTDAPVPNGTRIRFELKPARDFAGNPSPGTAADWAVDYANDKTPPPAPEIRVANPPAQPPVAKLLNAPVTETFSASLGEWAPLSPGNGGVPERVLDPERQDYALAVRNVTTSTMAVRMLETDYDASRFPWVSFDYKIPKQGYSFAFHFAVYVNGKWRVLELGYPIRPGYDYPRLRKGPAVVRDERWHTVTFNLHDLLREEDPKSRQYLVERLILVDWHSSQVPVGTVFYVDNFAILPSGNASTEFEFHTADSSGIKAFSHQFVRRPEAELDREPEAAGTRVKSGSLNPGLWYFQARAQDAAGNWGAPSQVPHHVPASLDPARRIRILGVWGGPYVYGLLGRLPSDSINGIVADRLAAAQATQIRRAQASPFLDFRWAGPVSLAGTDPDLVPTGADGKPLPPSEYLTICPTSEKLAQERLAQLKKDLKDVELAGVILSGVQFPWDFLKPDPPAATGCFNPSCLTRFQKETGITVPGETAPDKAKWILENRRKEWVDWKCSVIAGIVQETRRAVLDECPGALFGLAISPWDENEHQGATQALAGQDLRRLAKHVDFLVPMTLHAACGRKPEWPAQRFQQLARTVKDAGSNAEVWPAIQLGRSSRSCPRIVPEEFARATSLAIEAGAGSVLAWQGSIDPSDVELLASLKAIYNEYWRLGGPRDSSPAPPDPEIEQARTAIEKGNTEGVIQTLKNALARNPRHAPGWALLGLSCERLGQPAQAMGALRRALFEDPLNPQWWTQLGTLLKNAKRYDEAAESLQKALELNPSLAAAHYTIAATFVLRNQTEAAFEPLDRACQLDPGLKKAWPTDPDFKAVWEDLWFANLRR